MEYITQTFENTREGLQQKDQYTRQLAAQGYRIISEQIEQGHIKGDEQCCGALVCLPLIFLAGRTPGLIVVTYGREAPALHEAPKFLAQVKCSVCNAELVEGGTFCIACGANLSVNKPLAVGMKRCPFCSEQIQAEAKKCRFCGEFLESGPSGSRE